MAYQKNQSADDYIKMFADIYEPVQNIERDFYDVFARLIEALAACMQHINKGDDYHLSHALPIVFSWFCSLVYKARINQTISFDDIVWSKYPAICPYCKKAPCRCLGNRAPLALDEIIVYQRDNINQKPKNLEEWQNMFAGLYPRDVQGYSTSSNVNHLFEELGEISEAYRLRYFSEDNLKYELTDAFTWIIGIANLLDIKAQTNSINGISHYRLDEAVFMAFPGKCKKCNRNVCICSSVRAKISEYHEIRQIDMENLSEKIDRAATDIKATITAENRRLLHTDEFKEVMDDVMAQISGNQWSKDDLLEIIAQTVQKPEHQKWYKNITAGGLVENSLVSIVFMVIQMFLNFKI
jgi:hypothetical protein